MPGRLKLLMFLLCLWVEQRPGIAQYRFDNAIRLTQDDIIPSNDVRSIRLSDDGFVWIATAGGICRFDGRSGKIYKYIPGDSTSLFPGTVNMALPLKNEVWVATNKGISVLDCHTDKFRHYRINQMKGSSAGLSGDFDGGAIVLYIDRQNTVWAGTRSQGPWMFDTTIYDFKPFPYPSSAYTPIFPSLASNKSILSIEASVTDSNIVYAGTPSGLQEINKATGEVKWYTYPQKNKDFQVSLNAFRRLYHHDDGLLYVGSWSAGANVFNPVTKTFTPLEVRDAPGVDILKSPISRIMRKSRNEIWFTALAGMVVYDTDKKIITQYKYNNGVKNEFYGVECVDSMYRVWLNTINGVYYFDPVMQQFATYSYDELYGVNWGFAFYIAQDDKANEINVFPREANAFYIFDRNQSTFKRRDILELKTWNLPKITIRGFARLGDGNYFLSADEGLFTYNKPANRLRRYSNPPKTQFNQWGDVALAGSKLWIAANADGLVCRDLRSGKDRFYKTELVNPGGTHSLRPFNLFADSKHNLWFACEDGFGVYIAELDSIKTFIYRNNPQTGFPYVNCFAEDRHGRVWINTNDVWMGYCDLNAPWKGVVRKINLEQKGIASRSYRLAADSAGYVWGYSNDNLFKIDDPDKPFRLFSFNYGVQRNDFFHFSFLPGGEMVFGGRNSITLANPSELRRNRELPFPYILHLRVLNQPVEPALYSSGKLELNHKQNFFSITFSGKAYTMSQETRFRYRLKGFDNWTETNGDRLANYTNVPPGKYLFQLQAANNEGIWNEELMELQISIARPWWLSWWFRLGSVIALATLTWWIYRYRVEQIRKKEQLRSQYEKKLANVEMSALLAQMNPHFLFNSLNSIDSYIIKNESGKASEYLNNFARLMRLILQNSRSNYISLKDELETLDLYLQMESLRFAGRFEYEIKLAPGLDTSSILIPPMLIQPYVENAIWHGLMHKKDGMRGKVELIISRNENNLFCAIMDNGIGREMAETIRTQHSGHRKRSMGMQITRDRMEMINKLYNTNTSMQIIDLHDEQGKAAGTRVELVIPI